MADYNIPQNNYNPIRKEVVQNLIDFYLNNFGGDWFSGVWKVGRTCGLYVTKNGAYKLYDGTYKSDSVKEIWVTNDELLEFAKVWTANGYFISTCVDSKFGWREFAFTKKPYTQYNYRLTDTIERYL